ncbi:hypothetical protein K456DRAFT_56029 [Colletotrichum gloeosporioides 23]|nr:hypothetical protein K456DRAFT_56029 [Colletotrichum gloeosporioides 23]
MKRSGLDAGSPDDQVRPLPNMTELAQTNRKKTKWQRAKAARERKRRREHNKQQYQQLFGEHGSIEKPPQPVKAGRLRTRPFNVCRGPNLSCKQRTLNRATWEEFETTLKPDIRRDIKTISTAFWSSVNWGKYLSRKARSEFMEAHQKFLCTHARLSDPVKPAPSDRLMGMLRTGFKQHVDYVRSKGASVLEGPERMLSEFEELCMEKFRM